MRFTKMQGIGNDYVYMHVQTLPQDAKELAIAVSNRHFGVGSDGLVFILPSNIAHFKMCMFNPDGSEAMCGNASRCIGKYVYEKGLTDKTTFTLETCAGVKTLKLNIQDGKVKTVRVDMGEPILEPCHIPVNTDLPCFINQQVDALRLTCVSMGNPHAVTYVQNLGNIKIDEVGPIFEHHPIFPQRANIEFVKVESEDILHMRVWERGTGETLACGTGACAALVATVLNGLCNRSVTMKLLGGELQITWDEKTNHVYMEGPAEFVFEGEFEWPQSTL